MCTVSMIGDHYREKYPWATPAPAPFVIPTITRAEFDALRRDVDELKLLLLRAKRYDAEHGEPDCELDEKMSVLRRLAEFVGVDLGDVLN